MKIQIQTEAGPEIMALKDFMKASGLTELKFRQSANPEKTTQWVDTPFGRLFLSKKTDTSNVKELFVEENAGDAGYEHLKGTLWLKGPAGNAGTVITLA